MTEQTFEQKPNHKLSEESWDYVYETVISKIGEYIEPSEHKKFKTWFYERERVGYCFDALMILKAYSVWKELERGLDHFIVFTGREGFGKSTIAIQFIAWLDPYRFSNNEIITEYSHYLKMLEERTQEVKANNFQAPNLKGLILDEGNELLGRETMTKKNVSFLKLFNVQRVLGFVVAVCCPKFWDLDRAVRNRARTLIHIKERGKYRCISGEMALGILGAEGKDHKEVMFVSLQKKWFFDGDFNKNFPKTIDRQQYLVDKIQGIDNLLIDLKEVEQTAELNSEKIAEVKDKLDGLISLKEFRKKLSLSENAARDWVKKGKVPAVMIGGKWFVKKESLEIAENEGVREAGLL